MSKVALMRHYVDMKEVKRFAAKSLPECPLKEILLLEDDMLDAHIFLARLPVWLKLINILER